MSEQERDGGSRRTTPLASYRLGRIALDQQEFSASELAALARLPLNTVYSFIAGLGDRLTSTNLDAGGVGRPRKLYALTPQGVDYLLDRNLEIARALREGAHVSEGFDARPVFSRAFARAEPPPARIAAPPAPVVVTARPNSPFQDLFIRWLRDLYSAERQLVKALPRLAKAASSPALKRVFEGHLEDASRQVARLERIAGDLDVRVSGRKCAGMEALIEEAAELIGQLERNAVRDAGLIGVARKVEHYQIAAYATAKRQAGVLGYGRPAKSLEQTLQEETRADRGLAELAAEIVQTTVEARTQA